MASLLAFLLAGCTGIPGNVTPVKDFTLERYLGRWYEIARLDHSFERGLTRTTADYSLRDDGGVRVINRGYAESEGKWKEAEGRAYFVEDPGTAYLKVSFFGPFYGSYIVFELDREEYQYSLVCGPNTSYLWILSRTPELKDEIKARLVARAAALGFDTAELIYVDQQGEQEKTSGHP
jgi:apolipoprotein D and lipocalin family protein